VAIVEIAASGCFTVATRGRGLEAVCPISSTV
jgi:hypothetical protein